MKDNILKVKLYVFIVWLLLPCVVFAQNANQRNRHVDSLEQVLATIPPSGADLAYIYWELAKGCLGADKEKSMGYARKCIKTGIPLNEWKVVERGYRTLGLNFYGISQYDSAMFYYGKALEATEQMKDFPKKYEEDNIDDSYSVIYGSIANLYNIQGKNHEAIEYYVKALKLFEKHNWKQYQANANYNIGEMYWAMGNYEQAEIYYQKLKTIAHEVDNPYFIALANTGLSMIALQNENYDTAKEYAISAQQIFFSLTEERLFKVSILNVLVRIYLNGYNDITQAEQYLQQALQIINSDAYDISLTEHAATLALFSTVYFKRGEWLRAEQTALEALAIDDSEPSNTLVLYGILSKVYGKLGNMDKSWEYFDKHNALQSSWATKHYQSAIREMEVKYETEKKETAIAALETENRLITAEKRVMMWFGVVLLLALAALFFLWRWTVQKRRYAEQHIKQLEQEKQLIATQAVLDGETQERSRLARDLHDGLGSLLTGAKQRFVEMKKYAKLEPADEERFGQGLDLLDQSTREMRRVAHHLMPDALTRFGLNAAVSDFCSKLPTVEYIYYGDETRLDAQLEVMIYRCIYELVNNALKHSDATNIIVQIMQRTDNIAFAVQDDGSGFDPNAITHGTGLQNIRSRVATYNGIINIDTKAGEGSEINVELTIDN